MPRQNYNALRALASAAAFAIVVTALLVLGISYDADLRTARASAFENSKVYTVYQTSESMPREEADNGVLPGMFIEVKSALCHGLEYAESELRLLDSDNPGQHSSLRYAAIDAGVCISPPRYKERLSNGRVRGRHFVGYVRWRTETVYVKGVAPWAMVAVTLDPTASQELYLVLPLKSANTSWLPPRWIEKGLGAGGERHTFHTRGQVDDGFGASPRWPDGLSGQHRP